MSRSFVNVTWNNSAENYDGYQQMNRHMNPNGTAAIHNYSDEALAKDKPKKKSSLTIQQKILPQASRVERLTEQLKELVAEYQKGNIDIDEYSMLLSVLASKRDRAIKLLSKTKSVRAPFEIEEEEAISLGKTHVKSEKSFKTSKGIATEGNRFKDTKKPTISDDRTKLSKVADWINRNDWFYLLSCSTIVLTAVKYII